MAHPEGSGDTLRGIHRLALQLLKDNPPLDVKCRNEREKQTTAKRAPTLTKGLLKCITRRLQSPEPGLCAGTGSLGHRGIILLLAPQTLGGYFSFSLLKQKYNFSNSYDARGTRSSTRRFIHGGKVRSDAHGNDQLLNERTCVYLACIKKRLVLAPRTHPEHQVEGKHQIFDAEFSS